MSRNPSCKKPRRSNSLHHRRPKPSGVIRDGFFFFTMNIVLGITGSVSAYKTPWLVRDLRRAGHDVRVVMTPAASRFVTPLALEAVSTHAVVADMFDPSIQDGGSWHVHLGQWADVMLIAPCSATTLARLAQGLCDTAVQLVACSLPAGRPCLVAPAMDSDMWSSPAIQRNVRQVVADGIVVIPPASGELASGLVGEGRLPDLADIVNIVQSFDVAAAEPGISGGTVSIADQLSNHLLSHPSGPLPSPLTGKHVVVTLGPTYEAIDDVRFIGNRSSGKMGMALANEAVRRGALVTAICGPTALPTPFGVRRIDVESAADMLAAVQNEADVDVYIMAAAVADFTPEHRLDGKLKKSADNAEGFTLSLRRTDDILAWLGQHHQSTSVVVGFALESTNVIEYATQKLHKKRADMIVANSASAPRSGFGGDDNTITIITANNEPESFPPMSKTSCASVILDRIGALI